MMSGSGQPQDRVQTDRQTPWPTPWLILWPTTGTNSWPTPRLKLMTDLMTNPNPWLKSKTKLWPGHFCHVLTRVCLKEKTVKNSQKSVEVSVHLNEIATLFSTAVLVMQLAERGRWNVFAEPEAKTAKVISSSQSTRDQNWNKLHSSKIWLLKMDRAEFLILSMFLISGTNISSDMCCHSSGLLPKIDSKNYSTFKTRLYLWKNVYNFLPIWGTVGTANYELHLIVYCSWQLAYLCRYAWAGKF